MIQAVATPPVVDSFWTFRANDVVMFATILLAYLSYRSDQKNHKRSQDQVRTDMAVAQAKMAADNAAQLRTLLDFQATQMAINNQRDAQINELKTQTATLSAISSGVKEMVQMINKRVERIEDRADS